MLVYLSQGRLDERGCSAEDSGYPHPEDSSNPPRQIAVDTPMMFPVPTRESSRYHQCAERGYRFLIFRLFVYDLD